MSKLALIQMVSGPQVQENLDQAGALLAQAAGQGAGLAILPENFAVFLNRDLRANAEENQGGPVQEFVSAQAANHNLWIVAGTIPMKQRPDGTAVPGDRLRAASLVFDNSGAQVGRYDKIHLFDVSVNDAQGQYQESAFYEPGDEVVTVDTPAGVLGLTVCYDLRFPELYRLLASKGAEIFTCPAAFTAVTGQAHWEVLLRARAIENTCFMAAPDQGGVHSSKRETWGHSMLVDPWGRVVASAGKGNDCVVAEADLGEMARVRKSLPSLQHRML